MEVMMSFSGQAAYRFSLAAGFQRPTPMPLAIRTDEGIQALRPADGPGGSAAGTQAPAGTQAVSAPVVQPVPDTVPAEGTSPDANPPASAAVAAPAETAEPEAETSPQAAEAAEADAAGAALVRQQSFSLSRSTSLQIRTREGDLVTIELSLSVNRSQTLAAAGNGDTTALSYSSRRSVDLSMSFSIEGNLNKEERKAIGDLLHRIDKVTDKFYDGKVDAAFARLGKMEIDAEAIAGYSLSLEQTVSRQALTAYAAAAGTAAATSPAQVAGDYASEVRSLMAQPPQSLPFAETRSAVSELFSGVLEAKAAEQPEPPEGRELLDALLEQLETEDGEDD